MEKIKFLLLIVLGLILLSCQSRFSLKSDKQLNEIFSENEVKEFERMISYVDNRVVENTGRSDIDEAYHHFLDMMNDSISKIGEFVPFEDEEKYLFLESLDSTLFNDIWYMGNHMKRAIYKDSIYHNVDNYKYLGLRISGKYIDYLERIGKDDENYKQFKENIVMAGGIPPNIVVVFLHGHNEYDFTIAKNRLWATIFLLSMEESHDKKMERLFR